MTDTDCCGSLNGRQIGGGKFSLRPFNISLHFNDNCANLRSQSNNSKKNLHQTPQAKLILKENFDPSYTLFSTFDYIIYI